jgi:hypothetical protein
LRQPFGLAIKAKKHQPTQIAVDGSIASELVLTTLEATPDFSVGAHALKGRAAFFRYVTQASDCDFVCLRFVHASSVQVVDGLILLQLHFNCMTKLSYPF